MQVRVLLLALALLVCPCVCAGAFNASRFNDTRPTELEIDFCKLAFWLNDTVDSDVLVSATLTICYECRPTVVAWFPRGSRSAAIHYAPMSTKWGVVLQWRVGGRNHSQEISSFYDKGVYAIGISDSDELTVDVVLEPYNTWLPLVTMLVTYTSAAILYAILAHFILRARVKNKRRSAELLLDERGPPLVVNTGSGDERSGSAKKLAPATPTVRLNSLDTFRGICLTVMIFVNYQGGDYSFINHSIWNGLTIADLVFPWFVFLMGVSITLSFSSTLSRPPVNYLSLLYKIFRRAAILFVLGMLVNGCLDLSTCRIPGVLQRFSVSYLVAALVFVLTPRLPLTRADAPPLSAAYLDRLLEWLIIILLVVLWLLLTFLLPVPGCPTGYLGPGGALQSDPALADCTGGAAFYIDKVVFGLNHIYDGPTCKRVYQTGSYDPEGLLGCLTSIFLCYLGVHAGRLFVATRKLASPLVLYAHLAVWGVACGVIGTVLANGAMNGGAIPIAKNLWSLSFVLVMAGTGFLALALLHEVVDRRQWWSGAPFRFLGMNSIALYVSHEILGDRFPFNWAPLDTHGMILLRSCVGVTLWAIAAYYCYVIGFFVKI